MWKQTPIVIRNSKIWPQLKKEQDASKIQVNRRTACKEGIRIHPKTIQNFRSMNKKTNWTQNRILHLSTERKKPESSNKTLTQDFETKKKSLKK